jgi:hypothetical protein
MDENTPLMSPVADVVLEGSGGKRVESKIENKKPSLFKVRMQVRMYSCSQLRFVQCDICYNWAYCERTRCMCTG